jgi:hypothetical protein
MKACEASEVDCNLDVVYLECGGASCQFSFLTKNPAVCPAVAKSHKLRAAQIKRHSSKGFMNMKFGKEGK